MATTNYQLATQNATWVDVNSSFGMNQYPDLLPDQLAIQNSIYNLINCAPGMRGKIFQPEYGSLWYYFLQEPIDAITAGKMQISMIQAIARWEPRIILNYSQTYIIPDPTLPGYQVRISGVSTVSNAPINIQFTEDLSS